MLTTAPGTESVTITVIIVVVLIILTLWELSPTSPPPNCAEGFLGPHEAAFQAAPEHSGPGQEGKEAAAFESPPSAREAHSAASSTGRPQPPGGMKGHCSCRWATPGFSKEAHSIPGQSEE